MSGSGILTDIKFGNPTAAATRLRDHEDESHFHLFERATRERPSVTTTIVEGVCRSAPSSGLACRDMLRDACHCEDEGLRRELVRAFRSTRRDEELFLGAALLTREDGARVFADFFEAGGQSHEVLNWITSLATGYRREKRRGNIDPDTDGVFSKAWNDVKEAGKDIGDTIKGAVDKVEDALKQVGEDLKQVVSDVAEFTQRRINSVMETIFDQVSDTAAQVERFLEAATEETYSAIKRVVKGIRSGLRDAVTDAQGAIDIIVEKAESVGTEMLATATRALKEARESIRDIAEAATKLTKEAAATVTQALIDMVEYAQRRAQEVLDAFEKALEEIGEFMEYLYEKFKNYVNEWLRKAKEFGENLGADAKRLLIEAAREGRDALKSVLQGLVNVAADLGWILQVVANNVSDAFRTTVELLAAIVRDLRDLYSGADAVGLLDKLTVALAHVGEAIDDLVLWAADQGRGAIVAIHSVIDDLPRVGRNAVYHLGRVIEEAELVIDTLLDQVLEWGGRLPYVAFYGIIAGGGTVYDLMKYVHEEAPEFMTDGGDTFVTSAVDILREIGITIHDILSAGARLALDLVRDIVEYFRGLERSVWHLLEWLAGTARRSVELAKAVFNGLIAAGIELGQLAAWCLRRSTAVLRDGLRALRAITTGVGAVLVALLSDDQNVFRTAVEELRAIGATWAELFEGIAQAPRDIVERFGRVLGALEVEFMAVFNAIGTFAEETFSRLAEILLDLGYELFDMVLWAANKSFKLVGWVLDLAETLLDSWIDLLEFVVTLAPEPVGRIGRWLGHRAKDGIEFVRDEIVAPVIQAGKINILIHIGLLAAPFALVALIATGSLVDEDAVDYKHWPADFRAFECHVRARSKEIAPPTEEWGIVVLSDLHMEDQDDIDGGLGHFHKNADLVTSVLEYYASPGDYEWTVVLNGDSEEFWKDNDLTTDEPSAKVDSIHDTHTGVYETLSEEFYTYEFPRRVVKLRGNHDAAYRDPHVVTSYRHNGFPDIAVYDYVTTQFRDDDVVIMHGQQFDVYNCDANDEFGRFASNFASEPIDVWNDTLTDLFGEDARIEGETLEFDPLGLEIPVDFLAPYYERDEWQPKVEETGTDGSTVMDPQIDDGVMFEETAVVETIDELATSMIIGHTHDPKLMESATHEGVFYANSGTSGWWEGCIWTIEITTKNVRLVGWTDDGSGNRERTYVVGLQEPDDGEPFDPSGPNQKVTDAIFSTN